MENLNNTRSVQYVLFDINPDMSNLSLWPQCYFTKINYTNIPINFTGSPGKPSPFLPTSPAHKGPPPSGPPPTGPPPGSIPPPSRLSGPPPTAATPTNASPSKEDNKDLPVDVCETTLANLKEVLQSCQEKLQVWFNNFHCIQPFPQIFAPFAPSGELLNQGSV